MFHSSQLLTLTKGIHPDKNWGQGGLDTFLGPFVKFPNSTKNIEVPKKRFQYQPFGKVGSTPTLPNSNTNQSQLFGLSLGKVGWFCTTCTKGPVMMPKNINNKNNSVQI